MKRFSLPLVCLLALCGPAFGQAKKKNPNPAPAPAGPQATPEEYAQLSQQKEVPGEILSIDPETNKNRSMTFRYEYQQMEPNPNYRPTPPAAEDYKKDYQALQTQLQKAMDIQDPTAGSRAS